MSESWAERVVAEVTGWRLPRWAVVTAILGITSLILVVVCLSLLQINAQNSIDELREDAKCRGDVTLEVGLATANLVDQIARNPRGPGAPTPIPVADALTRLHNVSAASEALQKNKRCGYSGFIPSPTTSKP